jgi:hypothetical protein
MLRQKLTIVALLTLLTSPTFAEGLEITGDTTKGWAVFSTDGAPSTLQAPVLTVVLANGSKKQLKDAKISYSWALDHDKTKASLTNIVISDSSSKKDFSIGGGKNAITSFVAPDITACFGIEATSFPRGVADLTLDAKKIAQIKVPGTGKQDTNGSTICSKPLKITETSIFAVKTTALKGAKYYPITLA